MTHRIEGVEIFSTGKHHGSQTVDVTESDLDAAVASFDALSAEGGFRPVIKLGHDEAQKFFGNTKGLPNLGFIEKMRRKGSKLIADFADVPEALVDLIRKRRYNAVSIELMPSAERNGAKFSNVVTAVALLGAELPAVKGLKELASFLMSEDENFSGAKIELTQEVLYYAEIGASEREALAKKGQALSDGSFPIRDTSDLKNAIQAFDRATDKAAVAVHIRNRADALDATNLLPTEGALAEKLKMTEKDDVMTYTLEQHEALVASAVEKAVAETKAEFEAEKVELTKRAEDAETAKTEADEKLASFAEGQRKEKAEAMVDEAIKAGKLTPAQKDEALAFALSLDGTIKFGDKEQSASETFAKFISGMPAKVDFSEKGQGGGDENDSGDDAGTEVHAKTLAYQKDNKDVDYSTARQIVLSENPELKARYAHMED